MENQVALMLISHGNFASSALESAELIVGKQNNVDTMGVFVVDDLEELKINLQNKIEQLDTGKGLLILTDITGGTPMNLASNCLTKNNIVACSGFNLPVLLEILMNRDIDLNSLKQIIKSAYSDSLIIRTYEDINKEEEQDDML